MLNKSMTNLPKITDLEIKPGDKVIVRADLDVDLPAGRQVLEKVNETELLRLNALLPTLNYLLEKKSKIIIIGHRGRPEGVRVENLSLKPVCEKLSELLGKKIEFIPDVLPETITRNLVMLENLRFEKREEENDEEFAKSLAGLADFFVNEAFGSSHRNHASIIGISKLLPHAAGLRFEREIENLSKALVNPCLPAGRAQKPVVIIISGVKKDKIEYMNDIITFADKILIGGRLPEYLNQLPITNYQLPIKNKIILADLIADKEDITLHSVEKFKEEIAKAKTIILAGVPGKYEDEGHRQGTKEVFKAVADSDAFKIVGGGDSIVAIYMFNIQDKFNWVSVGGGAMLEFLAKGTLPGIEALLN